MTRPFPIMSIPARIVDLHQRFCTALTHRYFIRAHMAVMMSVVVLSGLLASRLLLRAGVANMMFRYPIAVLLSYLTFFGIVRLWLAYVCRAALVRARSSGSGDWLSGGSFDWGGGSGGSGSGGKLSGGGGGFGGGGASASFADGESAPARAVLPVPMQTDQPSSRSSGSSSSSSFHASGGKSGGGGGGGGGGDGDGLLLLVLFVVLVVAIAGAGVYLVYQAPVILSEAAFQAVLASGLARGARDSHDPGWAGSLARSTAIPFLLVLVLAGVFGYEAHKHCPGAATVRQVFRTCVFH